MDPLRPFAELIRSLRIASLDKANPGSPASSAAGTHRNASQVSQTKPAPTLRSRLRPRLAAMKPWDAQRARQLFVECALSAELGEDLSKDPAFSDLAKRVEAQIAHEPRITARLDELLRDIADGNEPR